MRLIRNIFKSYFALSKAERKIAIVLKKGKMPKLYRVKIPINYIKMLQILICWGITNPDKLDEILGEYLEIKDE